jgi:hypothetical protein
MKGRMIGLVLAVVAVFGVASAPAVPVLSTWDDATLDGWTFSGTSYGYWQTALTGGTPAGWVQFYDTSSTYTADTLHAPARYLGNYQPYLDNGWLEWDMLSGRAASIGTTLSLVGPGGRAIYRSPIPGLTWSHVKVELKPQYWIVSQGTWAGLMVNVTDLNIAGDVATGHGEVELGLDNFALVVPEPASLALLAAALTGPWIRRRSACL